MTLGWGSCTTRVGSVGAAIGVGLASLRVTGCFTGPAAAPPFAGSAVATLPGAALLAGAGAVTAAVCADVAEATRPDESTGLKRRADTL